MDCPNLRIIFVADSMLLTVSTLFPADHKSFEDFPLPLENARIRQNEIPVIITLILCLNLLFRRRLTGHELFCLNLLLLITEMGTPVSLVVHVISFSLAFTIAFL